MQRSGCLPDEHLEVPCGLTLGSYLPRRRHLVRGGLSHGDHHRDACGLLAHPLRLRLPDLGRRAQHPDCRHRRHMVRAHLQS